MRSRASAATNSDPQTATASPASPLPPPASRGPPALALGPADDEHDVGSTQVFSQRLRQPPRRVVVVRAVGDDERPAADDLDPAGPANRGKALTYRGLIDLRV